MQSMSMPSMQSNDGSISMPVQQSCVEEKQDPIKNIMFDFSKIKNYIQHEQAINNDTRSTLKSLQQNGDSIYGVYSNGEMKELARISYAFSKACL